MNSKVCIVLLGAIALAHAANYGKQQQSSSGYGQQQQQSSGYGKQQSSGYGQQSNGQVNYKLQYDIDLPKDNHGSQAVWGVKDDGSNANYNLGQTHPYGAQSNVYYAQQSDH